jgi:hypothetical protein
MFEYYSGPPTTTGSETKVAQVICIAEFGLMG